MKTTYLFQAVVLSAFAGILSGCPAEPSPDGGEGEGEGEGEADAGPDCPPGTSGCPCDAGVCGAGLVCDEVATTCRAPRACATTCAEHQICDTTGGDAVCLPACDAGFVFDDAARSCDPEPSCDPLAEGSIVAECAFDNRICDDAGAEVTCGGCLDDLIEVDGLCTTNNCDGLGCDGLGRVCDTDDTSGQESCGTCNNGHVFDAANDVCVNRVTCTDSPCTPATLICTEATLGSDRTCTVAELCAANQVPRANGTCGACTDCFNGATPKEGVVRGAVDDANNRRLLFDNICVCELEPGFFQSTAGVVTKCDADEDGWVTDAALTTIGQVRNGIPSPLAQEQTCSIRKIDRFELRTDDGALGNLANSGDSVNVAGSKVVSVDDLVAEYDLPGTAFLVQNNIKFVQMVEPDALDVVALFDNRYTSSEKRLQPYGGGALSVATKLLASEANPLTKACNHDDDDLNFDDVKDVVQTHHESAPTLRTGLAATPVFYRMSYFIELDRGFFEPCASDAVGCLGTYVIAEKRRDLDLVEGDPDNLNLRLNYNDDNGVVGDFGEDPYWQKCMRGREPDYVRGEDDRFNTDFARWYDDCEVDNGTCRVRGLNSVGYDGRNPNLANDVPTPANGVSDTGRWPGMGHHSQFKCVSFTSTAATDAERRPPARVTVQNPSTSAVSQRDAVPRTLRLLNGDSSNPAGDFTLMPCTLPGLSRASHPGIGGIPNPKDPVMSCNAVLADAEYTELTTATNRQKQNYFIGLRLPPYGAVANYGGGCIAESSEWSFLCNDVAIPNSQRTFGRLACGCDEYTAGAACEVGCGDERVMTARIVDFGEVSGFWMCAGTTATTNGILQQNVNPAAGFRLVGGVVPEVISTTPLCQTAGNCGNGFKISAPAH